MTEALDNSCYHCGLPVPGELELTVKIDGVEREMCCVGCAAVAQSIVDSGLTEYYRHRDALPESPREALPAELRELGLFDNQDFQQRFVRQAADGEREADLILEGITCAACVWLNERHVMGLPGVSLVSINYATRRARVRWDERRIKLSEILGAIQAIGYHAYPYDAQRSEQVAQRERRSALWRLFVAGFGMMQVMMYALPAYLAGDGEMAPDIDQLLRWASLVLTLPVVFYSAAPFFKRALRDLRLRRLGMDVPVALGVGTAFAASCWATFSGSGEVYFDSVAMFVFFLLCGRFLEMLARQRAVRGVEELAKVLPAFAHRFVHYPQADTEQVAVSVLAVGDHVRVKPGEVFPADGEIVEGASQADESLLTGESRPIDKQVGDDVIGGAINIGAPLIVRLERVGDSTRLAGMRQLMDRAATEKPGVVSLADRVAAWFIAALLVLATGAGIYWWINDPDQALWIFVSVLVVSCPCALSLATPAALTVATDHLARLGVLITRAHAIEALSRADHFVFDKTGTLSEGKMRIARTLTIPGVTEAEAVAHAASLEVASEHALAKAFVDGAKQLEGGGRVVQDLDSATGAGVCGRIEGDRYRLGRVPYVTELVGAELPVAWKPLFDGTSTVVVFGSERGWVAAFSLDDQLREDAAATVRWLQEHGGKVSIFSGDGAAVVSSCGAILGVSDARGEMSPEEKHDGVEALQREGAIVAMTGDGVNDAPVLAKAHVSIAMGGGTDLARTQADVVLLGSSLRVLTTAVRLCRKTRRIIAQNLGWALGYNLLAIPLAMMGMVTPWMAGIGMSASSLLVVLNAMRLQRKSKDGS